MESLSPVRVAIYGCGRFANETHLPNLRQLPGVEVVARCDADPLAIQATGAALEKSGGAAFDWGIHATDYVRFMTGLEVKQAQAFYHQSAAYALPLSYSFHYQLSNGAPMTMTFLSTTAVRPPNEPWFTLSASRERKVAKAKGHQSKDNGKRYPDGCGQSFGLLLEDELLHPFISL